MDNALRMERPGISTRTDWLGFPSGKIRGEAEPKVKIVSACQNASRTGSTQSIGWDRTTMNHTFSCKEGNGAGGFKTVSCRLRMKPMYSLKPIERTLSMQLQ